MDVAFLEAIRDGLFRRSEAAALTWGTVELLQDGSGRLHVAKSKADWSAVGAVLVCAIRPRVRYCVICRPCYKV